MKRSTSEFVVHGAIGGVLAGALVAVWFLGVDLWSGAPFRTPATLAAALLERSTVEVSLRLVSVYTVLHFTIFGGLGAIAALALALADAKPGWLLGALFGIGVLNAVHYLGLLISRAAVITLVPPVHVVTANLLGGVFLMTYLRRALAVASPLSSFVLRTHTLLTKGLVTGLIAAAAVALWFFILDVVTGQPFRTPAALGSIVLLGASNPAEVMMTPGILAAYTLIHLLVFGAAGVALVAAAWQLERAPGTWLMLALAFIILEAFSIPVLGLLGHSVLGGFGIWEITLGNLTAVASMVAWVWRTSPQLRRKLVRGAFATRV